MLYEVITEQTLGKEKEHRDAIYSWYNANYPYTSKETVLQYAFNKDFKRYAPSQNYPNGRFFDLRTDLLEREGENYVELRWGLRRYSGLDINNLTPEQKEAYDMLGQVLDNNKYIGVERLKISTPTSKVKVGEKVNLNYTLTPANATRNNIIWTSSDESIATIDKFGTVTALV